MGAASSWEERGGAALAKGFTGVQGKRSKQNTPGNNVASLDPKLAGRKNFVSADI